MCVIFSLNIPIIELFVQLFSLNQFDFCDFLLTHASVFDTYWLGNRKGIHLVKKVLLQQFPVVYY